MCHLPWGEFDPQIAQIFIDGSAAIESVSICEICGRRAVKVRFGLDFPTLLFICILGGFACGVLVCFLPHSFWVRDKPKKQAQDPERVRKLQARLAEIQDQIWALRQQAVKESGYTKRELDAEREVLQQQMKEMQEEIERLGG